MFLSNVRSLCNKTDEFLCNLQIKETTKFAVYFASQTHGLTPPFPIQPCSPVGLTIYRSDRSRDDKGRLAEGVFAS
ncbi:hypothetical protein NP493_45g04043 [Ridgeia piscesae]|uniref:Uncharacterized protein n=1 Tax=Ridgeia piscesae TaxID=27915 RepID=A0AAD9UJG2_RIDPI|nr:hypothetical protein NP493_45g04043 [Ridgeia piscesae]